MKQPAGAALVRRFSIVHERPMHLFVVGEGLEFFAHDHPAPQPDGVFMLDLALPRPGAYMAIAEFLPEGGTPQTFQQAFTTGSAFGRPARPAVDVAPKIVDGMRVSLDASKVRHGDTQAADVSGGGCGDRRAGDRSGAVPRRQRAPARRVRPIYRGDPRPSDRGRRAVRRWPSVRSLPRAGLYKAWIQFQRGGRVSTAAFVIDVP